jgi:DNA-directed RNA polymerase specialized sigma24 family protein
LYARFDGRGNARIWWHPGPSTAAAIWLALKKDRARIIFRSDLLRRVDVLEKARDPSTGFRTSRRAMDESAAKVVPRYLCKESAVRTDAPNQPGNQAESNVGVRAATCRLAATPHTPISDVLSIDHALERLAARDPEHARIVELRFFAGMSIEETAHVLDRSPATVKRGWRLAKAWLFRELRLREADQESRTR